VTALLAVLPALALAAGPAPAKTPAAAPAAKRELTVLYGDDHAFGIVVPAGWTVDDTSGINSRIRVVLYPKGQKWASAPSVMYVNPIHQASGVRRTLRQVIDQDVAEFRKKSPRGRVIVQPGLKTGLSQVAEVRYFSPTGGDPLEAVAYVAEEKLVMLIVLASRDAAGFQRHLPAFESLVSGYQFVAGDIRTPQ
jgi:hypothetical protein